MTCSSVEARKIYRIVPSSLKSAQLPPSQAHSWGPLSAALMHMGLESHPEENWIQMAGPCCEELWME